MTIHRFRADCGDRPHRLATYIDSGFWRISARLAAQLARDTAAKHCGDSKPPKVGKETLIDIDGAFYWLARTQVCGKSVWSIRATSWVIEDGRAVLRAEE